MPLLDAQDLGALPAPDLPRVDAHEVPDLEGAAQTGRGHLLLVHLLWGLLALQDLQDRLNAKLPLHLLLLLLGLLTGLGEAHFVASPGCHRGLRRTHDRRAPSHAARLPRQHRLHGLAGLERRTKRRERHVVARLRLVAGAELDLVALELRAVDARRLEDGALHPEPVTVGPVLDRRVVCEAPFVAVIPSVRVSHGSLARL
mmetsp:Transcript_4424/g.13421  ORF Transcript_4424/g.13421 Transcript_4424/m.13421 type:complete len:201 (-) Transcript_4424:115-717(-)